MNIKAFILLLLFSIAAQSSTKSFQYYSDGVYDAYTEIENSLRRGLREEKIKDLENRWLVTQDISNDSTVQIIFYRTVAHKNNFFEAVIATNSNSKKNYMVYGSYTRKADAIYALKKLSEKGIEAKVVYSNEYSTYVTNPIVVKKLIQDMKKLLKDTPVVVIRKTEILNSSDGTKVCKKCKPKIVYREKKASKSNIDAIVMKEFKKLQTRWRMRGSLDTDKRRVTFRERSGNINHYNIKDFFKGFKVTEVYFVKKTGYKVLKVMGINGKTYKLYKKAKAKKEDCGDKAKKTKAAKKTSKAKSITKKPVRHTEKSIQSRKPSMENIYNCDFNKIKVVYLKNGKQTNITKTHYGSKVLDVKALKVDDKYKLNHSGYETIFVKPFYFKYCKKM